MTIDATNHTPQGPPTGGVSRTDELDVTAIGIRLLDDAYMAWRAAEGECEEALQSWLDRAHARAYPAYRAALEREEAAARDLQRLSEIAGVRTVTPS